MVIKYQTNWKELLGEIVIGAVGGGMVAYLVMRKQTGKVMDHNQRLYKLAAVMAAKMKEDGDTVTPEDIKKFNEEEDHAGEDYDSSDNDTNINALEQPVDVPTTMDPIETNTSSPAELIEEPETVEMIDTSSEQMKESMASKFSDPADQPRDTTTFAEPESDNLDPISHPGLDDEKNAE